jgi:hypothetical protein
MQKIINLLFLVWVMFSVMVADAQEPVSKTGFGETMRSSGRIWVVIAVMLTILIGLVLYLVRLDRKISKLEKETN